MWRLVTILFRAHVQMPLAQRTPVKLSRNVRQRKHERVGSRVRRLPRFWKLVTPAAKVWPEDPLRTPLYIRLEVAPVILRFTCRLVYDRQWSNGLDAKSAKNLREIVREVFESHDEVHLIVIETAPVVVRQPVKAHKELAKRCITLFDKPILGFHQPCDEEVAVLIRLVTLVIALIRFVLEVQTDYLVHRIPNRRKRKVTLFLAGRDLCEIPVSGVFLQYFLATIVLRQLSADRRTTGPRQLYEYILVFVTDNHIDVRAVLTPRKRATMNGSSRLLFFDCPREIIRSQFAQILI